MRILVTGATGFLGRHLVKALRDRNDVVVSLVRDRFEGQSSDIDVFEPLSAIERVIAEHDINTVIHLAAQTQVSTAVADPISSWETNTRGTWQVLDACRRQKVTRTIVASSDKVYGDGASPYTEGQPLQSNGIYATSKLCEDLIAQAYVREYGMSIAITRCGNLYGPGHTNWSTLIPGTIRSLLRGEAPVLRSNGGPKRDYLYVEDAVDGYLKLIDSQATGAFNFGTGVGTRAIDVVKMLLSITKTNFDPIIQLTTEVEIEEQVLCCDRARDFLQWTPEYTLKEGLVETVEWHRERRTS